MARGSVRAAAQDTYRGAAGATRQAHVHVSLPGGELTSATVYAVVNVASDPELGQRLLSDDPSRALNVVRLPDGSALPVATPVLYHDPANALLVLVLSEHDRHRELAERARVYGELAADPAAAVPRYAREFPVVFGVRGLRTFLETAAEEALAAARAAETARDREAERVAGERRRAELAATAGELDRVRDDLDRRAEQLERGEEELVAARIELDRIRGELERARSEAERARGEAERARSAADRARIDAERARVEAGSRRSGPMAAVRVTGSLAAVAPPPEPEPAPEPVVAPGPVAPAAAAPAIAAATREAALDPDAEALEETTGTYELEDDVVTSDASALAPAAREQNADAEAALPPGTDPLWTSTRDLPSAPLDPWLEAFSAGGTASQLAVTSGEGPEGSVRLALRVVGAAAALARGPLDVRLQLHRTAHYPVITVTVAAPLTLRTGDGPRLTAALDVAADLDRQVLALLARRFALTVELVADGRRLRRAMLAAPLADNVAHVTRTATELLRQLSSEPGGAPSLSKARAAVLDRDFDLLALGHPEAGEFRDEKLASTETANQVRRAMAIARRFNRPAREDYLVSLRGYPLSVWRKRRSAVVQRAVELGLWMGPDLADLAVAEKLAGSRPALATLLEERFATTLADAAVNDLDSDAADDNRKALAEEARAHGLARSSEPRTVASETASAASGQIVERRAPAVSDLRGRATPELVALLEDRAQRVAAALELCERGDAKTIRPLILAARRMGRADAVRVLGAMVKFGPAAAPALTAGLGSSKSYLRHGCALALAMLRTEQGTDAVIDLLLAEPTELWRELARAVGQVGPTAMMPLAARIGRLGERATPSVKERAAWAMAHIGVRGGKAAVEVLGGGSSVVAPVARQALDLMPAAARDDVQLTDAPRDVTVNRAFSRRFFETVDRQGGADGGGGRPGLAAALAAGGLVQAGAPEAAAGEELLDEAELIEDGVETDDDADLGELDEADLIDEA